MLSSQLLQNLKNQFQGFFKVFCQEIIFMHHPNRSAYFKEQFSSGPHAVLSAYNLGLPIAGQLSFVLLVQTPTGEGPSNEP